MAVTSLHPSALTFRESRTGELLWLARPEDGTFSLQWMHSAELEAWRETFQLTDKGGIRLVESRFKAWGAGVPVNDGNRFYAEDGWFVMTGFDRHFPSLTIGVSCHAGHRILYNGGTYKLCDWVADGTGIVVKWEDVSLWTYLTFLSEKRVKKWRR